jgi:cell pole-organizing protein PopZ
MTQLAKSQEPSMEEILASIRQIIANDEPAQERAPTEAADSRPLRGAAAMPPPATLTARTAASASTASEMRDEETDAKMAELGGIPRQAPLARAEYPPGEQSNPAGPARQRSASEGLVSAATAAAVDAAFDALAQSAQPRNGRTVEELVSELIRPMLKTWLDDNLPAIVERLVRAEIERLSRGRE